MRKLDQASQPEYPCVYSASKLTISKGVVRDYTLAIRHVSGVVTEVLYNASLYRSESGDIQGVLAVARGVVVREVQGLEVVVVGLDVRTGRHVETEIPEDIDDLYMADEGNGACLVCHK